MHRRLKLTEYAPARGRREAQRRPVQGNAPHDRPVSRGVPSALVRLRRCLLRHPRCRESKPEDLSMRFFRDAESIALMWVENPNLEWSSGLPPATPHPSPRTCREDHALPIVTMSSDRLFLDRVGRHQSPSPLHRHPHSNTHSSASWPKGDISTLPARGHFYFALTGSFNQLVLP